MRTQLERIEQDPAKLETAQADVKKSIDDFKAASNEKIAEWKDRREKAIRGARPRGRGAGEMQH